jgi:hypothetical protein
LSLRSANIGSSASAARRAGRVRRGKTSRMAHSSIRFGASGLRRRRSDTIRPWSSPRGARVPHIRLTLPSSPQPGERRSSKGLCHTVAAAPKDARASRGRNDGQGSPVRPTAQCCPDVQNASIASAPRLPA